MWSCSRWQTQPEKICKLQSTNQYNVRSEWHWFVCCDLQIFSSCVCHFEQLHAQSPFLFPIVFSINLFHLEGSRTLFWTEIWQSARIERCCSKWSCVQTRTRFVASRYVKFWFCNTLLHFFAWRESRKPRVLAKHLPPNKDKCAQIEKVRVTPKHKTTKVRKIMPYRVVSANFSRRKIGHAHDNSADSENVAGARELSVHAHFLFLFRKRSGEIRAFFLPMTEIQLKQVNHKLGRRTIDVPPTGRFHQNSSGPEKSFVQRGFNSRKKKGKLRGWYKAALKRLKI